MKSIYILLLVICSATLLSCTESKSKESNKEQESTLLSISHKSAFKEVEEAVNELSSTLIAPNQDVLAQLTDQELTYGHSSGKIQNKSEFIDDLMHGPFDFLSITLSKQSIHIDGNTAIVRHVFESKASNADKPVDVKIGVVLVYIYKNNQWKLLARQAYKV
ncbi:nuclear transport factor 2 family protein [Galbibacter sp. PAP.153]|uniref:nuclear transport factor 2 family protein n=1 Tax=Galbibacter sp. PAP.153 TaxID=3104623 RepID=UPI003008F59E